MAPLQILNEATQVAPRMLQAKDVEVAQALQLFKQLRRLQHTLGVALPRSKFDCPAALSNLAMQCSVVDVGKCGIKCRTAHIGRNHREAAHEVDRVAVLECGAARVRIGRRGACPSGTQRHDCSRDPVE
jgi:hypothetical protein